MASEKVALLGNNVEKTKYITQETQFTSRRIRSLSPTRNIRTPKNTYQLPPELEVDAEEDVHFKGSSLTELQALMHLFKATIGTGVLTMPNAVKNSGILFGLIGFFVIGLITLHCMRLLVSCAIRLRSLTGRQILDYPTVSELAVSHGHARFRKFAGASRWLNNFFLLTTQLGLVAVYYLFVAENTKLFVDELTGRDDNLTYYMIAFLVIFLPYAFINRLDWLAPFAFIANIAMFVGLGIILVYCVTRLKSYSSFPEVRGFDTVPLFLGTIFFSFESINLVLSIENKMKDKQGMIRLGGILDAVLLIIIAIYASIGFFGYLCFGNEVQESITYSMPTNTWYYISLKLIFSLSVFVSYGLQFYLLHYIIWRWVKTKLTRRLVLAEATQRILLVLFSFGAPLVVPHLDLMISLVGAWSGSGIIFIYPAVLHTTLFWEDYNYGIKFVLYVIKNSIILLFGIFSLCVGMYAAINQIVLSF